MATMQATAPEVPTNVAAGMVIDKIETFPLRIPFRSANRAAASEWLDEGAPAADSLLVRVTTSEGVQGWGEAFGFRAVSSAKLAIEQLIAPLCVGRDATQIASLMQDLNRKLHIFGRGGPLMYGFSAVDIALWDIAGKTANAPVHRLLGGGVADLPCYASLNAYSDPELVRADVRRALDAGFRAVKLHETELPVIRAACEEAGPGVEVMLDVNCAWTLNQARARAEELKGFGLKWLEEPVWPPDNYDGLARLRETCGIEIAAGENVSTLMAFDRLMAVQAVDYIQPSPAKMGGISELRNVFSLAQTQNVAVMPHTFYDGPGLLAGLHVTAALGSADSMIEYRYFDLEANLHEGALAPRTGRLVTPQQPGLGFEPDQDVISKYLRA